MAVTEGEKYRMLVNAMEAVVDTVLAHNEGMGLWELHSLLYRIERLSCTALKELER